MTPQPRPGPPDRLPDTGWHGWLDLYGDAAMLTLAALPVALLAARLLARRRHHTGTSRGRAWRTSLTEVGILYGTLPSVWLTMQPGRRAGEVAGAVSLLPLRDLVTMGTFQIVGNLLVFAALGLLAPLRFAACASIPRVVAIAATGSALIETAQYVLRLDRVSSVDDVLLNTAGAGLAALASRRWWSTPPDAAGSPEPTTARGW